MNVLRHNPEKVEQKQIDRMNALWGDESWREVAYKKQQGFWDTFEEKVSNQTMVKAFRKRLKTVTGFGYVPEPLPMRNSTGATVYYLFFASPKETDDKIVTDIFNKYKNRGLA